MKLIDKVLNHPLLQEKPPVLIDIGASENLNPKWKSFAKHSICIAFDADDRDFSITSKGNNEFKKLYKINRKVTANDSNSEKFYLTKSPYGFAFELADKVRKIFNDPIVEEIRLFSSKKLKQEVYRLNWLMNFFLK